MHQRFWCTKHKKLRLFVHQEEKAATIYQILKKTKTTLGKILALRRQCKSTQRRNGSEISPTAQQIREAGLLSEVFSRRKPNRTMLEARKKRTFKSRAPITERRKIPPAKNIQQHKRTTKNVQISKRLAIR